jgi:hypothetical protein
MKDDRLDVSPHVFAAPMLPFRDAMLHNKAALLNEVARRIRVELNDMRAKLPSGTISEEDLSKWNACVNSTT